MEARTESSRYQVPQTFNSDENIVSLFEPDTLVSAQYFENLRSKTLEPEKRLMLAVLEDAINCFQDNLLAQSGKRKRLFEEAEDWILAGIVTGFFPLRISVRFVGSTPNMSAKGSYDGRKRNYQSIQTPSTGKGQRWPGKNC